MSFKLRGTFPALPTPISSGDSINAPVNFEAMKSVLEHVIGGGVTGVVPVGCTGHAASLTHDEQVKLIDRVNQHVNGRVPVVAGDGSNCTREAIDLARKIEDIGVEIHMQISPYQNKPTPEGIFQHYSRIANSINGTLIVYNVPGRTGLNILPDTVRRLAEEHSSIIGIKEACGNISQIRETIQKTSDIKHFSVVSGDDGLAFDVIKAGGTGLISVAANLYPGQVVKMVNLALSGRLDEARALSDSLQPLFKAMFYETNPSPLHYALRRTGINVGVPRLPLVDVTPETGQKIDKVLENYGLYSTKDR